MSTVRAGAQEFQVWRECHEQPSSFADDGGSAGHSGGFGHRENRQTQKKGTREMKEFLTTLTAMLLVIGVAMWLTTPVGLAAIMEWILCAAVILWFLPNVIFA
jgi:hypothetical protein